MACWILAGVVPLLARAAEIEQVAGIAVAPEFSEWTVRHQWTDDGGRLPVETRVVKNGKVRLERHRYKDGGVDELWSFGGVAFSVPGNGDEVFIHSGAGSEFGAVDWIHEGHFKSDESLNGREVRLYEAVDTFSRPAGSGSPQPDQSATDPEPVAMARAWIDVETGLPLRIENAEGKFEFEHLSGTAERLEVPPAVAEKIEEIEKLTTWYRERNRRFQQR